MDVFSHGLWAGVGAKAINLSPRTKNSRLCKKIAENPDNVGYKILGSIFARFWCGAIKQKPLKVWLAMLWGVFPDVFAFAISFLYLNWVRLTGGVPPFMVHPGDVEPPIQNQNPLLQLTHSLYNISHSLFIFFIVFGLVAWYFRRPVWEMGRWLLHILMDIPSHSYAFFPTPFLWPFSDFKVNGIPWGTPAFFWTNYFLIISAYVLFWILGKRKKNKTKF